MGLIDLCPLPKQLIELEGTINLDGQYLHVEAPADTTAMMHRAVELVQLDSAPVPTARTPLPVDVRIVPDDSAWPQGQAGEEAYRLELRQDGGRLTAASEAAVVLGCQTIRQLLLGQPASLPALRIVDWPDFRYRGLYVESKWGPDLMSLEDWKVLVDDMASRKFNVLGVGVYGCWVTQYGGKLTEFMMLPFPEHPELSTPKTLRYYSAVADTWQTLEYLPRMVTEDFFGELVAYAKQQNVTVRPHFNSPGHSTLIPRAYPDVSAKSEDGSPIGYGFCLSNPRTYDVILSLYDSVIERHLRPHGVAWFHIGLDEVEAYAGIDPSDPFKVIEPWCQCPECRDKPRARQLQAYAVRVCTHLKQQGITHITMWNDALDKLDALDETFGQMLAEAGLQDNVVVQWWRYNEPVLIPRPEIGVRAWTTPMAGYWSNLFTHSYTSNIYGMLLHAWRTGAEGADAYCIYDPAFDRNYACLAEYAWNQVEAMDLYEFKSRYARAKLGGWLDRQRAVAAFDAFEQAFDAMPWTGTVLASLLYYWHTYPAARREGTYPRDIVSDLQSSHMRLSRALASAAAHARTARDLFATANERAHDPLLEEYRVECAKLVGVWEAVTSLTQAIEQYQRAVAPGTPVEAASTLLRQAWASASAAQERWVALMAELERVKVSYLRPQILRDLSVTLLYIEGLQAEFGALARQLETGGAAALPPFDELSVNQLDLDPFVSTATAPSWTARQ